MKQNKLIQIGREIYDAGFVQTSHKYRMVCRIPAGKTALESLKDESPDQYKDVMKRAEEWARRSYHMYVSNTENDTQRHLSVEEFAAFKLARKEAEDIFSEECRKHYEEFINQLKQR